MKSNLDEAAKDAAGNWRNFDSFCWFRSNEVADRDNWAVIYTHHRDSGLVSQSNATVIESNLEPFSKGDDPDLVFESHSHWAVGHVDGFSLRVYRDGEITDAFRAYHDLDQEMADYPILDEAAYSEKEYDATVANIADAAWRLKKRIALPEGWESEVYSWLGDHIPTAIDNCDDQGGYPSERELETAVAALGYSKI